MKTALFLSFVCGLTWLVPEAAARGRYTKGRTAFHRKCTPCVSIGWKWSPERLRWRKVSLRKQARAWSSAQVCTWMRKNAKRKKGPLCHPSKMTYREKLNVLYYIKRRAQGKIRRPVLRRRTPKVYRGPKFKQRAKARRARALRQHRDLQRLRKARRRFQRRRGKFNWSRKRKRRKTRRSRRTGR